MSDTFNCPITLVQMNNPVTTPSGRTYEKEAIENWIDCKGTSPMSRNPLSIEELRPNRALKDLIDESKFKEEMKTKEELSSPEKKIKLDELKLELSRNNDDILLNIKPPIGIERTSVHICMIIDKSGSMGSLATAPGGESDGLTLLDIVKHGIKTIISMLTSDDRFTLLTFSTNAQILCENIPMDANGHIQVNAIVNSITPDGQTNIWEGLKLGLDSLKKNFNYNRLSCIYLLTDGCPNIVPPRGHSFMLKRELDSFEFNPIISTFGFGYNLDSKLLDEISTIGNGEFIFIPDPGFVGTTFVTSISNILTTYVTNAEIKIGLPGNIKVTDVLGKYDYTETSWGIQINIGNIQYDQTRSFIFSTKKTQNTVSGLCEDISVTVKYRLANTHKIIDDNTTTFNKGFDEIEYLKQKFRLTTVECLQDIHCNELTNDKIKILTNDLSLCSSENYVAQKNLMKILISKFDNIVPELTDDIQGQIMESLNHKAWIRWGRHYSRSLGEAHNKQKNNNFKDKGIQNYGGDLFKEITDHAEQLFMKIPAPKPSYSVPTTSYGASHSGGSYRPVSQPVDMSRYMDRSGGCISGECFVGDKKVSELRRGDKIMNSNNQEVEIECVIKRKCQDNKKALVIFENGLKITAWHPIFVDNKWIFPCSLVDNSTVKFNKYDYCEAVYTFILKKIDNTRPNHIIVNGIKVITLAHNIENDNIASHNYYGTDMVIEDMRNNYLESYNNGFIEIN